MLQIPIISQHLIWHWVLLFAERQIVTFCSPTLSSLPTKLQQVRVTTQPLSTMVEFQAESKPSHKVDVLNLSNLGSRRETSQVTSHVKLPKFATHQLFENKVNVVL